MNMQFLQSLQTLIKSSFLLILLVTTINRVQAQSPGGVSSNLQRWYKADAGITIATGVSIWADQSGNSVGLAQVTAANQPGYSTTSNLVNFNPTLSFDGTNDRLSNNPSTGSMGTGAYTIYYVASNTTPSASKYVLGMGASANLNGFNTGSAATATTKQSGGTTFATQISQWAGGIPNLTRTGFNGGATQPYYLASNGGSESISGSISPNITSNNFSVGARPDGAANFWGGNIAEVILYTGKHGVADYSKVESYLGIKYGITKTGNYTNTSSDIIWDATTNASYLNNIAGIGRDDLSGLNQKQSKSVNSNSLVTIGLGSIAASNSANANTFSTDQGFEIWGDNGASVDYNTSLTPPAAVNVNKRMTRLWKVQETGSVGVVQVAVPASYAGIGILYLVRSSDALIDSNDEFIPMNVSTTINGTSNVAANIDFNNGDFYTFATFALAPGGVTNGLVVWHKTDRGLTTSGSNVTSWLNMPDGTFATNDGQVGHTPQLVAANSNNYNFNPYLNFVHVTGYPLDSNFLVNTGTSTYYDYSTNSTGRWAPLGTKSLTAFFSMKYPIGDAGTIFSIAEHGMTGGYAFDSGELATFSQYALYGGESGISAPANGQSIFEHKMVDEAVDKRYFYQNETLLNDITQGVVIGDGGYLIGSDRSSYFNGNNRSFRGTINEVIAYNTNLSASEEQRIRSYLAVKNGVTLAENYIASDGTTLSWNYATNSAYTKNVLGIGRDDFTDLHQRISTSATAINTLVISTNTDFTSANISADHTDIADDKKYLVMGDNGLAFNTTTNVTISGQTFSRLNKIWKAQDTNDMGCVNLRFNMTGAAALGAGLKWYVIVADDAAFATNVRTAQIDPVSGYISVPVRFNNANSANNYITLAQSIPSAVPTQGPVLPFTDVAVSLQSDWLPSATNTYMEVHAKNQGFVVTRVDGTASIASPLEGMLIFDTSDNKFKVYNGTSWRALKENVPTTTSSGSLCY